MLAIDLQIIRETVTSQVIRGLERQRCRRAEGVWKGGQEEFFVLSLEKRV